MDPKRHQQAPGPSLPVDQQALVAQSEWVLRSFLGLPLASHRRNWIEQSFKQQGAGILLFDHQRNRELSKASILASLLQSAERCERYLHFRLFFFHSVMDKSETSSLQKVQCVPFLDLSSWSRTHVLIQGHADLWVHPSHLPWSCLLKKKWAGVVFSVIVASWISVTLVWRQAEITDCRNRKLHIKAFCQLLRIPWQYYVPLKISCTRARTVAKKMRGRILVYHHVSSHSYLKLKTSCCFLFPVCKLSCQQIDH